MVKSKYKNRKTEYNGRKYDSNLEASYSRTLDLLRKSSSIDNRVLNVEYQVPYKIFSNKGFLLFTYLLDFKVNYHNRTEYVDTKGVLTQTSRMKILAVQNEYEIKIALIDNKNVRRYIKNNPKRI